MPNTEHPSSRNFVLYWEKFYLLINFISENLTGDIKIKLLQLDYLGNMLHVWFSKISLVKLFFFFFDVLISLYFIHESMEFIQAWDSSGWTAWCTWDQRVGSFLASYWLFTLQVCDLLASILIFGHYFWCMLGVFKCLIYCFTAGIEAWFVWEV